MSAKRALTMRDNDNVATVLEEVSGGDEVAARLGDREQTVPAIEDIPYGFKIALADIPKGELIYKYGEVIGRAVTDIARGQLVHVHNLEGTRGRGDLEGGE